MDAQWVWWIAAAVLIGAELMSGTFYLLAIGIALAIGGLAAWLRMGLEAQFLVAVIAGIVLVFAAHRWRRKHGRPPPPVPHDVGQTVRVAAWNADGTARVDYRGTQWTAELAHPGVARHKTMVIVAVKGPNLVVDAPKS